MVKVGYRAKAINGEWYSVVKYENSRNIYVVFDGYSEPHRTTSHQINTGEIRNKYKPRVYGVGFIGIGKYNSRTMHNGSCIYTRWSHMLERCYNEEYHSYRRYGGRGVTVCGEWHCFQEFAEWFVLHHIEGFELDKDILNPSSKEYSPDNCVFIPQNINKLFTERKIERGEYPIGVLKRNDCNSFVATCDDGSGKSIHIGCFDSQDDAFNAYKEVKIDVIKRVSTNAYNKGLISDEIYKALLLKEIVPYPD